MSGKERRPFLICYDVAHPKRLRQLHGLLRKRAIPVQYSVFAGEFGEMRLEMLIRKIGRIIHHREDDVRIYPVPRSANAIWLGESHLPAGVFFAGRTLQSWLAGVSNDE